MKIGIVCYPTFGGSGVVATELGMELANKGHQVHFISYSQPFRLDRFSGNLFYHEVPVANYPLFEFLPYEISLTSKLVDVALHHNLDLLHVHYAIPHASAAFMAREILRTKGKRVPYITTLHGTDITLVGRDPSYKPVIEFAINHSDAVTAVSESLRDDTLRYFEVNRSIDVIPNFIELNNYNNPSGKCHRSIYAPNGEKILTHISNFRPVKRIADVVKVFERWEELIMGLEKLLRCLLSVTVWKWIGVECSGRVYRMDPGTAFTFPFALSIWTYLLRSERNPLRAPVQR